MLRTTLPHPMDFMLPRLSHFTLTKASTHVSLPSPRCKSKLSFCVRFSLPSNRAWGHVFWIVTAGTDLTQIPRTSPIRSGWQRAEGTIWSTSNEYQWFLCASNPSAFDLGEEIWPFIVMPFAILIANIPRCWIKDKQVLEKISPQI